MRGTDRQKWKEKYDTSHIIAKKEKNKRNLTGAKSFMLC